ncbi:MAG: Transcriptional regulator PadR-like family [Frankiaceae bacterium]|nr:Transcriptional regulator PadR-like family [Frankiaceae bacterium]
MRRRAGIGLVRNESKILAAALRLAVTGTVHLYGYELFAQLSEWEGDAPMNHGTLYRCLRRLEQRGLFLTSSTDDPSHGPARVFYELTQTGVEAAREATVELASEAIPPAWVDVDIAHTRLRPTT